MSGIFIYECVTQLDILAGFLAISVFDDHKEISEHSYVLL